MEPIVFRSRIWSALLGLLVCLVLTVVCGFGLVQGVRYGHASSLILGILGTPLMAALAVSYVKRIGKPVLVVDERGVSDNTSPLSLGLIPWEQIRALVPVHITGAPHDYVYTVFVDPQWPWAQMSPKKRLAWEKLGKDRPPCPVVLDPLPVSGPELAVQVMERGRFYRPDLPAILGPVRDASGEIVTPEQVARLVPLD
ncbi:MAG: STM3941 family protein [Actinomycetia bacterium]|nr:STM3941 family protein [Actinomycetes bacterium]